MRGFFYCQAKRKLCTLNLKMAKYFKRTKYVIATQFQLRFAFLLTGVGVIVTAIVGYILHRVLVKTQGLLISTNIATSPDAIDFLRAQESLYTYALMGTFLGVTVTLLVLGIVISHRLAGPVFAIGRKMSDLAQGNFNATLQLRKSDEFQDLKDKFNTLVKALQNQVRSELLKLESITEDVKSVLDQVQEPKEMHDHLRSAYTELQAFYNYKKSLIDSQADKTYKPKETSQDEILV
ncbi:MAG: hypothetical protein A3B70_06520 [Deltaproteobacteria bacterium RIFCSPHIGHO2_02_FULL_40_11]|nr:MAG: hypothetical protein A3B70_06520 [Deltaproteobacteria bacterium RIFCSPHIGHO2_02_FULL_40_11]